MPDLHNLETFLNRAWQLASFFNQSIVESIVFITVHPRERLRNPLWYELIKNIELEVWSKLLIYENRNVCKAKEINSLDNFPKDKLHFNILVI